MKNNLKYALISDIELNIKKINKKLKRFIIWYDKISIGNCIIFMRIREALLKTPEKMERDIESIFEKINPLHRPERKMRQKCNKNISLNFI
jgi:thiamine phosphate synthase YjbQ (UPF0047 family)